MCSFWGGDKLSTLKESFSNIIIDLLQEMFPNYPELLCQAVSLARRVNEPLTEFTSLFLAQEDEILALRMHVLQVHVFLITTSITTIIMILLFV